MPQDPYRKVRPDSWRWPGRCLCPTWASVRRYQFHRCRILGRNRHRGWTPWPVSISPVEPGIGEREREQTTFKCVSTPASTPPPPPPPRLHHPCRRWRWGSPPHRRSTSETCRTGYIWDPRGWRPTRPPNSELQQDPAKSQSNATTSMQAISWAWDQALPYPGDTLKRSWPTGGAAYGIPRKAAMGRELIVFINEPRSWPCATETVNVSSLARHCCQIMADRHAMSRGSFMTSSAGVSLSATGDNCGLSVYLISRHNHSKIQLNGSRRYAIKRLSLTWFRFLWLEALRNNELSVLPHFG